MDRHESYAISPESSNSDSPSDDMAQFQQHENLQQRSVEWLQELDDNPPTPRSLPAQDYTLTETISTPQLAPSGSFFMGNVNAQHIGLAGCGVERSEQQIKSELEQVYTILQRSDRYQKYRAKQPMLTPAKMLEREKAEREEAERKGSKIDEKKAVWPEFLERAFWRALVRWPPMGRKKCVLNGALRGRNELIQQSIFGDTGINRSRKQVSSHIQVLKIHLRDEPSVLMYMATQEDDKRRRRGSGSSHVQHSVHVRGSHVFSDTASPPQHEAGVWLSNLWSPFGDLPPELAQGMASNGHVSAFPYSITDFSMRIDNDEHPAHYFTQMASSKPLCDLELADTALWRPQFPEFYFLQGQMQDWPRTERKVIVCDASMTLLTQARPNANLSITLNLESQMDLTAFGYLECLTKFYDNGNTAPDPKFDGANSQHLKEQRLPCAYVPNYRGPSSLRLGFGSKFWVSRMLKYQNLRNKDKHSVVRSLRNLTATQDVYGINRNTGSTECILTILWRFSPTKAPDETGTMTWRVFSFRDRSNVDMEQNWGMGNAFQPSPGIDTAQTQHAQGDEFPFSVPMSASTENGFFPQSSQHQPQQQQPLLSSFQHPQYNAAAMQHMQLPFSTALTSVPGMEYNISLPTTSASARPCNSSQSSLSSMCSQDILSAHHTQIPLPEFTFANLPAAGFEPGMSMSVAGFVGHPHTTGDEMSSGFHTTIGPSNLARGPLSQGNQTSASVSAALTSPTFPAAAQTSSSENDRAFHQTPKNTLHYTTTTSPPPPSSHSHYTAETQTRNYASCLDNTTLAYQNCMAQPQPPVPSSTSSLPPHLHAHPQTQTSPTTPTPTSTFSTSISPSNPYTSPMYPNQSTTYPHPHPHPHLRSPTSLHAPTQTKTQTQTQHVPNTTLAAAPPPPPQLSAPPLRTGSGSVAPGLRRLSSAAAAAAAAAVAEVLGGRSDGEGAGEGQLGRERQGWSPDEDGDGNEDGDEGNHGLG